MTRYGFAVAAVGLALVPKLTLDPALGDESPFLLFFAAVTLTAWYGGVGPGVAATVGASAISAYFFFPPYYSLAISNRATAIRLAVFVLEGVVISIVCGGLRAARRLAETRQQEVRLVAESRQRLFEESEARRARGEALAEVGHLLSRSLDPREVSQLIADNVRELLGARSSAVYRLDTSGALVGLASSGAVGASWSDRLVFPPGTGVGGAAVEAKQPIATLDILSDPRIVLTPNLRERIESAGYRAVLAVPLLVNDRVVGALGVGDIVGRVFDSEAMALARRFADQAAVALDKAQLHEQSERERRRLLVLYDVTRRLAAVQETDAILAFIVDEAAKLLGAEAAGLRLVEGDSLVARAKTISLTNPMYPPRLHRAEGLSGLVLSRAEPVVVEDLASDSRYHPDHKRVALAHGYCAFIGVPLMVREHPLGVLAVFGKHRGIFGAEEVGLLAAFADQAAVALGKDRLAGERRRVEETLRQNEKMASLGRLLAGVAHELNNPLTVVIGNAQLLQREMRGDGPVQRVGQIVDAGERCARIIRSFLAIARQQPPDRGVVDVNDVIHAALEMLQYSLRVHDIDVVVELADDLPDVWADHQQLHQVLVNLLSNAQDALREIPGPRALTIRSSEASLPRRIVIELIDAGRGMDAETQGRIFDPFFTTKPVGQGTGLGLSVCHAIIAAHDGHLSVESQAGHGTTVRIEFPVMEHPAVARATEALTTIGNQKRILLVDDEPMVRAVLGTMLSNDGHEIVTAEDGLSAVRALERGPFDLIIADIKMPVLDGPGLYRQLQTRHSGLEDRMIFITGDVLSSETKEFLETVRPVSLTKPFGIEALRSAIACVFRATH